ncbi:hypothetical protein MYX82_06830 [Acidobacteria bacterium AH-259-D05]|nr:hypothetical protein [Acidobacteria bacterium AH-259-D05]
MSVADFVFEGQETIPDDIVAAVLVRAADLCGEKEHFRFPATDSRLQDIMYALAQTGEGDFLKEFVFSDKGLKPYSPLLTEVISRLQLSGIIGRENPDFRVGFLREGAFAYVGQIISKLDKTKIDSLAKAFLEERSRYL